MVDTPIDSAITSVVVAEPSQGDVLPDSNTILAANPQLIMDPGIAKPVFKFEDGAGLTDAFGNVYEGYAGAGGSSEIVVNPSTSVFGDELNASTEGQFLAFDDVLRKYIPKTFRTFGAALVVRPIDEVLKLILAVPYDLTITATQFSFDAGPGSVAFPSGTILQGNDLSVTVSGTDGTSLKLSIRIDFTINLLDM